MDLNLKDRVVLVTGANRGIGRAIAQAAVDEGAVVAVLARDAETSRQTVAALGEHASSFVVCDVSDPEAVVRAVEAVSDRYGRLDAVVNNAGRFGGGPVAGIAPAALREGLDTKVVGALGVVQAALPALRRSDQPRVVNIAGVSAQRVMPGAAVTAMANAAMITLTAYLARELIGDRVNVNCVIPGYVLTDPWRRRTEDLARAEGLSVDAALVEVLKRQDMGHARWGTPREIAEVVVFLLSAQAGFVNGATFRVDGGQFVAVQN
ncbi:MAG TPA: SDR family oxidoreductase [Caulobacteraceae bacterium]|nr:SDR family oxidoreductase [Caulobacteraceae bacterium]